MARKRKRIVRTSRQNVQQDKRKDYGHRLDMHLRDHIGRGIRTRYDAVRCLHNAQVKWENVSGTEDIKFTWRGGAALWIDFDKKSVYVDVSSCAFPGPLTDEQKNDLATFPTLWALVTALQKKEVNASWEKSRPTQPVYQPARESLGNYLTDVINRQR